MAERTRRRAAGSSARRPAASRDAGGRLNRDYSDEEYRTPDEGYDGPEPTKGLYTAELVRINDHTKRDEDAPSSVRWLFRLVKGSVNADGDDVSGWMDSQYTTENTAFREQQMLVATGVIKPNGKVNLPYDGIVKKAKACTVRVGIERVIDEDGEGSWKGRMQAFLPLRETTAERRGVKRSRDEDDVFDDEADEDVDDEGDEDDADEEPPARSRRSTSRSRRKAEPEEDEDDEEEEGDEDEPDDEDEEEEYDPDALAAELQDLSLAALKKRARDEFGVRITRGMKADAIINAVLDTLPEGEGDEDEDEDDEEEEPPPPPKRSSRARSAKPNSRPTGSRRKRGSSDEPPF